jgi:DNA-directed RNA polymerase specialized sigma24 family protein
MEGMTDRADAILAFTPTLRRHARLLTGSQAIGDEYVRICLEAVLEDRQSLDQPDLEKTLFRILYSIWDRINADFSALAPNGSGDAGRRLEQGLLELAPVDRRALLLVTLEGYRIEDAADILGLSTAETMACVNRGRERLGRWSSVRTLIIEDQSAFAMELQAILEDMGHSVMGVAGHVEEALDRVRTGDPGLVLADIELADNDSGIDAARRILKSTSVPLIFVTGYPDRLLTGEETEPAFVVPKPVDGEALKVTIAHVLALYDNHDLSVRHRQRMLDKLSGMTSNVIPFPRGRMVRQSV